MRHALIRLFRLLDVNAHWHVVNGSNSIFAITKKKFHNILQGIALKSDEITMRDSYLYNKWSKLNAECLMPAIKKASVIVIDDPQPSGLIPYIKRNNPSAKIIYRSHIHIDTSFINKKNTFHYRNWKFIWKNIKQADLFISHPVLHFIPELVTQKKTVLMPAATDLLDGLNKPLLKEQISFYISQFNKILEQNNQTPLDLKRPYIIQIARFDPFKGIPDVLESYQLLRKKLEKTGKKNIPQLVLVGHGSVDDPEGKFIFNEIISMLKMDHYALFAKDIKIARLYPNDQILNALLRASKIAVQLSYKEGFEVKVTEALHKGIPVVAYNVGGIPLQIENNKTGYLIKMGDTRKVADCLYDLITNKEHYCNMSKNAKKDVKDFFTVKNAINWLFLANELMEKGEVVGNAEDIEKLIKKHNA